MILIRTVQNAKFIPGDRYNTGITDTAPIPMTERQRNLLRERARIRAAKQQMIERVNER